MSLLIWFLALTFSLNITGSSGFKRSLNSNWRGLTLRNSISFDVSELAPSSIITESCQTRTKEARVFDRVLGGDCCSMLENYQLSNQIVGFTVFERSCGSKAESANTDEKSPLSRVEKMIDSILTSLGDDAKYVEYWWGRQWVSHPLHRDVDEFLAKEERQLRYPRNGHVLYLSYEDEMIGGPTVVIGEPTTNGERVTTEDGVFQERQMYVVPPRPGRLLRFQGDLLHGVPRPPLEYFLSDQSVKELQDSLRQRTTKSSITTTTMPSSVQSSSGDELEHEPEGVSVSEQLYSLGAEDCTLESGEKKPIRRQVLLFNTWPDQPPRNAPRENDFDRQEMELMGLCCLPPALWREEIGIDDLSAVGNTGSTTTAAGDSRSSSHSSSSRVSKANISDRGAEDSGLQQAKLLQEQEQQQQQQNSELSLTMRIGLPADRLRRDSYESTLVLQTSSTSPLAFLPHKNRSSAGVDGSCISTTTDSSNKINSWRSSSSLNSSTGEVRSEENAGNSERPIATSTAAPASASASASASAPPSSFSKSLPQLQTPKTFRVWQLIDE